MKQSQIDRAVAVLQAEITDRQRAIKALLDAQSQTKQKRAKPVAAAKLASVSKGIESREA